MTYLWHDSREETGRNAAREAGKNARAEIDVAASSRRSSLTWASEFARAEEVGVEGPDSAQDTLTLQQQL